MSVLYEVLAAVKSRVAAVSGTTTPKLRKAITLLEEDKGGTPIILISPILPEKIGQEAFPNVVCYGYVVDVVIYENFDRSYEITASSFLELREDVRDALYQPLLTGVASVYDTDMDLNPPFNVEKDSVYEITGFRMTYWSKEARVA